MTRYELSLNIMDKATGIMKSVVASVTEADFESGPKNMANLYGIPMVHSVMAAMKPKVELNVVIES